MDVRKIAIMLVDSNEARRATLTRRLAAAGYAPLAFPEADIAFRFFSTFVDEIGWLVVSRDTAQSQLVRRVRGLRPDIGVTWIGADSAATHAGAPHAQRSDASAARSSLRLAEAGRPYSGVRAHSP